MSVISAGMMLPVETARRVAPDLIIDASSHSVAEACEAEHGGAYYVRIGPVFPTRIKEVLRE